MRIAVVSDCEKRAALTHENGRRDENSGAKAALRAGFGIGAELKPDQNTRRWGSRLPQRSDLGIIVVQKAISYHPILLDMG